jgi:hypothetical protein
MKYFYLLCLGIIFCVLVVLSSSNNSKYKRIQRYDNLYGTEKLPDNSVKVIAPMVLPTFTPTPTPTPQPGDSGYGTHLMKLSLDSGVYLNDLLNLYQDSADGLLSSSKYHVPASALLSMHINESGTDGDFPSFFFPVSRYNIQNGDMSASAFTVRTFDSGCVDKVNSSLKVTGVADSGPFQIGLGQFTNAGVKSLVNGWTNSFRSQPDIWFLPDSLAWMDNSFSISVGGLSESDIVLSGLYSNIHNRGSFTQQMYGTPYSSSGIYSKTKLNKDNVDVGEASVIVRDLVSVWEMNPIDFYSFSNPYQRYYGISYAIMAGYKMTNTVVDVLESSSVGSIALRCWNDVNVDEAQDNISDLVALFRDKYVSNLSVELGITSEECESIYGTSGDYVESYNNFGYLFKVEDYRSNAYINILFSGEYPKVVHAYDTVVLGHITGSTIMAEQLWNYYCKMALRNSDLTNPDTYYNRFKNEFNP